MFRTLRARIRSGLAVRLLITILISSTVITCLSIAVQLYVEYRADIELIEQRITQVERSYADSVALSVWNFDRKQYEAQLDGILHFQDIVYAEIRSPDDQIILARGSPRKARFVRADVDLITTDFGRTVQPGRLVVVATLDRVYNDLIYRGLVILLTQGVKTFVVSIVILLAFHWLVTRHLYRIADYTKAIDLDAPERLALERPVTQPDELDVIVHAINDMQDKIQGGYRTIADLNLSLEQKVVTRTAELEASKEKFAFLFHNAIESVLIFQNNRCVDLNAAGIAMFGFRSSAEAVGLEPRDFVAPESVATVLERIAKRSSEPYEAVGRRRDGSHFPLLFRGRNAEIDGKPSRITSAIDLTHIKQTEAELRRANRELEELSHRDPMTGAYNRRFFKGAASRLLSLARREGQALSVAMLDIDDFKSINDRFGHDIGDQVICHLVELIEQTTRDSDLVARFGGEEFVLLLPNTALGDALEVAEKIRRGVVESRIAESVTYRVSIGVATVAHPDEEIENALARADRALFRAKRAGKDGVQPA
jgi:diguanylate cyclase (GGDEF)-like protein/PAS domain S-box-containing protein